MNQPSVDWPKAMKPLLKKYKGKQHPLEAKNAYQMLVMVVLSAQTTDVLINKLAPQLFERFPDMGSLAMAAPEMLHEYISKVRNFGHKAQWLVAIAKTINKDGNIPLTIEELVALPGIGRKSANVIKHQLHAPAEGVVVDLHTVRVANRLGIVNTEVPDKIEKQVMEILPKGQWDAGMAMSFLGREICRPEPQCPICLMKKVCAYYNGWL